jgi:NADH-quinone oxidoreductase subunit G
MPKSEVNHVWKVLNNPKKRVIIAIAPAVRAAIGEVFGFVSENGTEITGNIVTALRSIGFANVFDISFTADMTIVEETNEFVERLRSNKDLPMFTSCCPAWVRFVEQYYPDFIRNLSTCRSPQGIYGSIARKIMPKILEIPKEDLIVVSVMPCTAKKYEARRTPLAIDNVADINYVLTTQELARMIEESGFCFDKIEPSAFDMPLGFKTGGGIIFGNSGGVTEAVLRNIVDNKSETGNNEAEQFSFVRGENAIREIKINFNNRELKMIVVYGLGNARKILRDIKVNTKKYDFLEVMACPNGCIGGAGQPVYTDLSIREKRAKILYENDKTMELHKPYDNLYVQKIYEQYLGKPGSIKACKYLHTKYEYRKRFSEIIEISKPTNKSNVKVNVCFGNNCIKNGAKEILKHIVDFAEREKYKDRIGIEVSICLEKCSKGPVVKVAGNTLEHCTPEIVERVILEELSRV